MCRKYFLLLSLVLSWPKKGKSSYKFVPALSVRLYGVAGEWVWELVGSRQWVSCSREGGFRGLYAQML